MSDSQQIAIIGLAGRFPGADNLRQLWRNLRDGVESIRFLDGEDLARRGLSPDLAGDPDFVAAEAFPNDYESFDPAFFDMSRREAEITDPQHRLLLECAWEAFEDSGYDPYRLKEAAGVFAGATLNTYLPLNLLPDPRLLDELAPVQLNIGNASDFLATRIAYKLDLKGPSHSVQSACSTSLVAVHLACQKLLDEECDLALAGGVSINLALRGGYRHLTGGMASPDGRCRPFGALAQGTIFGGGAGMVLLKRLDEALRDGDPVRAVILGSAVNNDGRHKVGFTAPSVEGQAEVIAEALANAGLSAESLSYIEAHGTATPLGDPIEIQALRKAFAPHTERRGFCAIGSAKSNFGHLDAASGVAGLIKTVLALEHEEIPPSLHGLPTNPEIDFASSPFFVNGERRPWSRGKEPRRAGVSSFGVGGTNAHVIVGEAPRVRADRPAAHPWQAFLLSARTASALERQTQHLASYLQHAEPDLADLAFTLQQGRHGWEKRRAVIAESREHALTGLDDPGSWIDGEIAKGDAEVVFLFPGQGSQYLGMASGLYAEEPVFRRAFDRCREILKPLLGEDPRDLLWPTAALDENEHQALTACLNSTRFTQPLLFAVEWSLAEQWKAWGVGPKALIGHSLGEYVAACLAGVFTLPDALRLMVERGRLMADLPAGGMLSLPLSEEELTPWLARYPLEIAVASLNGFDRAVVAGPEKTIAALDRDLAGEGIAGRRLPTTRAFHSPMVEAILEPLGDCLRRLDLQPPHLPFVSNLTGTWIRSEEAVDPAYWLAHSRQPVRFAEGLDTVLTRSGQILLEVGPGRTLTRLAGRHPRGKSARGLFSSLPRADEALSERRTLLSALAGLWTRGVEVDWPAWHAAEGKAQRRRVGGLPTYPFDRQRCFIDPPKASLAANDSAEASAFRENLSENHSETRREREPARERSKASNLEKRIVAVWKRALGVDRVGLDDNFFDLGGDSLVATQAIDQLKREFEVEIPVAALYEGVTVRTLASVLRTALDEAAVLDGIGDGEPELDAREERMQSRKAWRQSQRSRRRDRRTA